MPATRELKRRVLDMTAHFEGGWEAVAGNFDGQVLSYGPLQWNLGTGTLQPMLKRVPRDVLAEHLGTAFVKALYDGNIVDFVKREVLDERGEVKPEWRGNLVKLARTDAMRNAFVWGAAGYYRRGEMLCRALGFKTERGYALCFDTAVQNGAPRRDHIRAYRQRMREDAPEWWNLAVFAQVVADSASPRWRQDVLNRKLTVARGRGMVHGRYYDLERDFGISYHRPWDIDPFPCGIHRVFLDGVELQVERMSKVGSKLYIRTKEG